MRLASISMNTLDGIHAKLRRAENHAKMITTDADHLCAEVRRSIAREVCEEVDEQTWVYRGKTPEVPVEWLVILGEIFYNLRSALDHLVWQLVLNNGQSPGRHNQFPITKDDPAWLKTKDDQLKGVSMRHKAMIGYLQPHTGGINLPFNVAMLEALNELCNIDKHRTLLVAVMATSGPDRTTLGVDDPILQDSATRHPFKGSFKAGRVEEGTILLTLNNARIDISPSFKIGAYFGDNGIPGATRRSVRHVLSECLRTVRGSVDFLTTPMGYGFVEGQGNR